jgi:hypothetical protein
MNQEPVFVKLLTQSKPIQYFVLAISIILVVWALKQIFRHQNDDPEDLKKVLPKSPAK